MDNFKDFKLIVCIVNRGFADEVMDAAREAGCRGGTVLHGRGTSTQSHTLFGMPIEPEKEVVLIASRRENTKNIMESVFEAVGLATPGSGICFAVPINEIIGLNVEGAADIKKAAQEAKRAGGEVEVEAPIENAQEKASEAAQAAPEDADKK